MHFKKIGDFERLLSCHLMSKDARVAQLRECTHSFSPFPAVFELAGGIGLKAKCMQRPICSFLSSGLTDLLPKFHEAQIQVTPTKD